MFLELAARRAGTHAQGGKLVVSGHKKTRASVQRTGFSSARFSWIYYAPASCGPSNRRESRTISGGEVQIQLGAVVLGRVAGRIPLELDVAQVVARHIAGDVVPVEAG